jgi:HEAT repeat protein
MSALTSLLVRDRVVSVSKIEEALHSQVFQGGDIEVILLEMGLVPEDVLSAYRAALFDLLPATREEVMKARDALRRVPSEMARSLGIVPIFFEGRSLVVAAWEPLYEPRLREVEAQLGCEVSVRIVNQARLASALAHHYGFELEPRLRRLSDALRRRDPGVVPYVRPPSASMRPVIRENARRFEVDSDNDSDSESEEGDTEVVVNPLSPQPADAAAPVEQEEPLALASSGEPDASVDALLPAPSSDEEPPAVLEPAPLESAQRSGQSEPSVHSSEPPAEASGLVAVELPEEESDDNVPHGVSPQLASLVRGAISLERAVELLQVTSQRDDVLFVLLRYVQQFFDFVCLFSVGKDGVRARMAHGAGLPRDLVETVFVPSPRSGVLAEALTSKRAQLGVLGSAPEEESAAGLLHREPDRAGLVVPVELNQRVILLVYADRVHPGLQVEQAGLVLAVLPAVVNGLRRIILETKQRTPEGTRPSYAPPAISARPSRPPASAPVERAPAEIEPEPLTLRSHSSSVPPPVPEEALPWGRPSLDVVELTAAAQQLDLLLPSEPLPREAAQESSEQAFQELGFEPTPLAALPPAPGTDGLVGTPLDEEGVPFGAELSAVDLDAFERMIREEPASDLHAINRSPTGTRENAQVRERIAGVPRTAPPPPMFEPAAPAPTAGNGYRYSPRTPEGAPRHRGGAGPQAASAQQAQPGSATAEATRDDAQSDRHRLSLVEPSVDEPSVIIDMGDSVDALVGSLLHAAPGSEPREIDELLTIGESALPVLMQHFPGPLWIDRQRAGRRKLRGRDISAVARAIVAFGERAAPYLASLLSSGEPERTFYALLVAGEIIHPDLIDPVARRVLDRDDALRALALEVLRSYSVLPQYDVVVRAISDLTERPGKDPRRQRLAVEALGALRDARTLRTLLVRLSDRDEEVVRTAHHALVVLTGQDFGFGNRKWETWVEGWGRAHRVEWLIESLMHPDEGVRTIAGEELKLLTQQYFGYHPALSKREREVAQRKYREWWELEGRLSFNR